MLLLSGANSPTSPVLSYTPDTHEPKRRLYELIHKIQQQVPMPFDKNKKGENVRCIWVLVGIAIEHNYTRQREKVENNVHLINKKKRRGKE